MILQKATCQSMPLALYVIFIDMADKQSITSHPSAMLTSKKLDCLFYRFKRSSHPIDYFAHIMNELLAQHRRTMCGRTSCGCHIAYENVMS